MQKTGRELSLGLQSMEHSIIRLDGKNIVTKDNKLIEARYNLTKSEAQLIFTVISQIDPMADDDFKSYKINVDDFIRFINVKTKDAFGRIEQVVDRLQQNILKIKQIDDPENQKYLKVGWIMAAEYNPQKREIYLMLHPDLKPFLLGLKERFTSYRLEYIIALKSIFSIRLYELLKQYENSKHKTRFFDINELKDLLEINKKYSSYGMFKKRILLTAQEEINKKTDISFDFFEITEDKKSEKGRKKIVGIKFVIYPQKEDISRIELSYLPLSGHEEINLFSAETPEEEMPEEIERIIQEGINKKEAEKIRNLKFDYVENKEKLEELIENGLTFEQYLRAKIALLEIKKSKGIDNPGGWLKQAIKNNYTDSGIDKKLEAERVQEQRRIKKEKEEERTRKLEQVNSYWNNQIRKAHNKYMDENPGILHKALAEYCKENGGKVPFGYKENQTPEDNYKKSILIRNTFDWIIDSQINQETIEMIKKQKEETEKIKEEI